MLNVILHHASSVKDGSSVARPVQPTTFSISLLAVWKHPSVVMENQDMAARKAVKPFGIIYRQKILQLRDRPLTQLTIVSLNGGIAGGF